jgi:hypothetical protein
VAKWKKIVCQMGTGTVVNHFFTFCYQLKISVADPGWVKNQDPEPDPDHISESLKHNFLV